ncbi:sodium:solute symporter family protein [Metallosphaera hakonensis]|uniref:sodium:solute symporter family protein n=1 Tax=Metallosphaera hakonensis TaxID=79601 RepID=UPI001443878C|nr:sodium:solute symporter [Metallosphaera hakonensis]AWS00705.2 sodium:solute symporter [Metallosphaera hakonensis JCM 8857 = DSM 7519]
MAFGNIDYVTLGVFIILFAIFAVLGFWASRFRRGDLSRIDEWGLGGRRLGWLLVWFLMGADLFTAYTFIAVPSSMLTVGSLYFFAVPYVAWGFAVALLTMPRLWTVSRNKGYVTASDFVKDRFDSKWLAIAVALTGVVAELPYIALQIVGMQAVLASLLVGLTGVVSKTISDIALIIAFIVLASFTFTSGLRGAALTGVFKDILIWITVLAVIIIVPLSYGGFAAAFSHASTASATVNSVLNHGKGPILYGDLSPKLIPAYFSLSLGSALALYLYPHAINGSLSSEDRGKLKLGTSLLPIYGIGLALLALFGILVYAVPNALQAVLKLGAGTFVVPALISYTMPDWFIGLAYLAIFIGGLVPAAIMAIGVANLLVRNVVKEFKSLDPRTEATLAKIVSTVFKFVALGFVFVVPSTYAIQLQLLGGILVTQTLPSVFLGLYTKNLNGKVALAGWAVGIISALALVYEANAKFGVIKTSLYSTPLGPLYIAILALLINLAVTVIGSAIAYGAGWRPSQKIKEEEITKEM